MSTGLGADKVITILAEGAELRTWSLIVTIFGDMARAPGAEIPGPVLNALTARMGVKPETTRVALHRLRKDGWIASRRAGRVSHYLLTDTGRAEAETASARIFARQPASPDTWHLVLLGPGADASVRLERDAAMSAAGRIPLAPDTWLGAGVAPENLDQDGFVIDGTTPRVPGWLRQQLMPDDLFVAYAALDQRLAAAKAALDTLPAPLSPIDTGAIRILVVHGWRRLVLRHPDLPDAFFPTDWTGASTRAQVHDLLDRLGTVTPADLAGAVPA